MDIIDGSVSGDSWKAMFAKHDVSQPRIAAFFLFVFGCYWNHKLSQPELYAESRVIFLWFSRLESYTQAEVLLLTLFHLDSGCLFRESWSDLLTASELLEVFGCVCAVSETVSFSIVSRRRQTGSQTVFSLSLSLSALWNKSLFVFQESHSSVSSLFPSALLPVKAVLAFPVPHILKWTVKTRCSEGSSKKRTGFCSSSVGSVWRYRAYVLTGSTEARWPRHAV